MPYMRHVTLGALGDLGDGYDLLNAGSGEGVTFEQCQAIINHQTVGGIEEKLACARKNWIGNRPQVQPVQVPVPPLQLAVQPTVIQAPATPISPLVINPVPPSLFEETVNTIPPCEGFDQWISDNKVLALGIAALLYFVR